MDGINTCPINDSRKMDIQKALFKFEQQVQGVQCENCGYKNCSNCLTEACRYVLQYFKERGNHDWDMQKDYITQC